MRKHAFAALAFFAAQLAALVPSASSAGPLAPTRASDLVALLIKDSTPCAVAGLAFDTRVLPDGTEEPFAIPPKRVLVVTSLDFVLGSASPGVAAQAVVSLQSGGMSHAILVGPATTDVNGTAVGTVVAPTGVAVKSGQTLCLIGGTTPAGVLHGFLAKDK